MTLQTLKLILSVQNLVLAVHLIRYSAKANLLVSLTGTQVKQALKDLTSTVLRA